MSQQLVCPLTLLFSLDAVDQGGMVRLLDKQSGGIGVNNFDYFTDFRFLFTSTGTP